MCIVEVLGIGLGVGCIAIIAAVTFRTLVDGIWSSGWFIEEVEENGGLERCSASCEDDVLWKG